MTTPTNRLLIWTGVVLIPFLTFFTASSAHALFAGCVISLFAMVVLLDAVLSVGRVDDVMVELPEVTRFSIGREGSVQCLIKNAPLKISKVRFWMPLPLEFKTDAAFLVIDLPGDSKSRTFKWTMIPTRKGEYAIPECRVETDSPFGFWAVRKRIPVTAFLRVYPNLLTERKNFAALFLNKGVGIHALRWIGKGREFEQLREYLPGDSFEDIHWKATAKQGSPITKVFQVERTQEIYVVIDASRMSGRLARKSKGTNEDTGIVESQLDRFVTAALLLGLVAERCGDMFGLVTFDSRVRGFIKAKNGKAHYGACQDILYTLRPNEATPDFDELFTFIGMNIRRRALMLVLTNLDDPMVAESFLRHADILSRRHLVLVNMMKPEGAEPLFDSPDVRTTGDIYKKLGGHMVYENLRETEKRLSKRGIGFQLLNDEKLCAQLVSQYIQVKKRQAL